MTQFDSRGLPISTQSSLAAERYREGIDLLLSLWPGAAEALEAAITADPGFALAHAARARLHATCAEPVEARTCIAAAEEAVLQCGTERERSHVAILSLIINGRSEEALTQALTHSESWPRDVMILSLPLGAFGLFAFSGMVDHDQARVDLCERHARHFEADDWWFLFSRGWSHAENGNVTYGRTLLERALGLRSNNANTAHALLHAMYEGGAGEDAETLITNWLPNYDRSGILYGHIAWHGALCALERGDAKQALAIYADHVQPSVSLGVPVNVVSDAASFLWRLEAYGHKVPAGLWEAAATYSSDFFQTAGFAFADVHMAILSAAIGEEPALEQRVEALTKLLDQKRLPAGPIVPAICRAALAFTKKDYAACAHILEPLAADVARIGGSGAQRDMFEDMLLLAWIRSGAVTKARALLDRRLHQRPSPRDTGWRDQLGRPHVTQ